MREIYVEKSKNNNTLVSYISGVFQNLSQGALYKALRNKDIRINDKKTSKDVQIQYKDKINIYISDNILFNLPKELDTIYMDDNILVVYKPQGVLSNDEEEIYNITIGGIEPTFDDIVKKDFPEAKICHRLDRNTAGLLLFSRNDITCNELLLGFKNECVLKEYIAYVANSKFDKNEDTIEKYITKDSEDGFAKVIDEKIPNSKKIVTKFSVLKTNKNLDFAILNVKIHAGKTHQIRAQMANISHPIIGDSKYGKNDINKKFRMYKQLLFAVKYSFNFPDASPLYYLNKITIQLDNKYYIDKLNT